MYTNFLKVGLIVFITLLLIPTLLCSQSDIISVAADRYYVNISNRADYTLSVKFNGLKRTITPQGYTSFDGFYSKSKLSNSKIICSYNQATYLRDANRARDNWNQNKSRLKYKKEASEKDNQEVLRNKAIAESVINIEDESDDWWITKKLKEAGRFAGKSYKKYRNFVEEIDALQGIDNWDDLEDYLDFNYGKYRSDIKYVSRQIERKFGTNKASNESMINAAIYYFEQLTKFNETYENGLRQAEKNYENRIAFLDDLLASSSDFQNKHTYSNTYKLVQGDIDFSTKTPKVLLSIEPLVFGNSLNQNWDFAPEQILIETGENQYKFGNAFHDTSIGGSFKFSISPEVHLSKKNKAIYGRLFAGIGYYRAGYQLNGLDYSLSTDFFSTSPATSPGFTLSRPLRYEQIDIAGELSWRFFLKKNVVFDLNGGYARQSGTLNLSHSMLSEGYTWTDDFLAITDEQYAPFFGAKFGIGKNNFSRAKKLKGIHFSGGVQFSQPKLANVTDFRFVETSTDRNISFGSNGAWVYRVFIGLGFGF